MESYLSFYKLGFVDNPYFIWQNGVYCSRKKIEYAPRGKTCCIQLSRFRCVHRKEKNFSCGQCEYKTYKKSDMTRHENAVHRGTKIWKYSAI